MTITATEDLFTQVADFLFKHRYHNTPCVASNAPVNEVHFSSIHDNKARMHVQSGKPPGIIISMIHEICTFSGIDNLNKLSREVTSFNDLMGSALLPVFLWVNSKRGVLELHWQETFNGPGDLLLLQNMCNQAEYLSFSVAKKIKASHCSKGSEQFEH